MRELLDRLSEACGQGRDAALCSVIETRGSTPQKPGAAMLVLADGTQFGTLGGGCTEAEVKRQALTLFGTSDPKLFTFTLDDNYGWDDGLICGGRMTFVVQPIAASSPPPYFDTLRQLLDRGEGCTEAVVIDSVKAGTPVGARWLFDCDGRLLASLHCDGAPGTPSPQPQDVRGRPKPYSSAGLAYIPILPRCRLLIVGAGHVGQAVADLAARVDFDVWILDDRDKFACPERFPTAQKIWVEDIGTALKSFEPDRNTYCLIMTRGHANDEEALFHLAGKPARYVGLIGSRRKIRLIFEDLEKDGVSRDALAAVHAPLGFDIGSQTVPEIAVSIVAHLVGHRNRGSDSFPPNGIEHLRPARLATQSSEIR